MGTLDLLDFLTFAVGVFDLLSKLSNIHPVIVYNLLYEFLLALVFPEKRSVGPLVLAAVFGDLIADFVQI